MKVTGTGGLSQTSGARPARPAAGGGFSLGAAGQAATPQQASGVGAASSVMGVQALVALQDVGGPLERRGKAVRRAGLILDVLDEVKLALLDGALSANDLERLRRSVRDELEAADDPGLDELLRQIETRAAVELAKLECSSRARER